MEFLILGYLEVIHEGAALKLGGPRDQKVLAMLLLNADRPVPVRRLVDALWEDDPPATVGKQVLNVVSRLRGIVDDQRTGRLTGNFTRGYQLRVGQQELDARIFQARVDQAGRAARQHRLAEAADLLRSALNLWRGPALAGIDSAVIAAQAAAWDEQRLSAL